MTKLINKAPSLEKWNLKYQELYEFVCKYNRLPRVYEKHFFDGTDMYKWYITQMHRLPEIEKPYSIVLNKEQTEKIMAIKKIVSKEQAILNNKEKLKEVYKFVLQKERFPYKKEKKFSDNTYMNSFIEDILNEKIKLTEKEQAFFKKMQKLTIRLKKDGKKGIIKYNRKQKKNVKAKRTPKIIGSHFNKKIDLETVGFLLNPLSLGSALAYIKALEHKTTEEMATQLDLTLDAYRHIENNLYETTIFHIAQSRILLKRLGENKTAKELEYLLDEFPKMNNTLMKYLIEITACFSFTQERPLNYAFYKDYRCIQTKIPKRGFYISQKLKMYQRLKEIEASEKLVNDEKKIVEKIIRILEKEISEFRIFKVTSKRNLEILLKNLEQAGLPETKELQEQCRMRILEMKTAKKEL